MKSEFVAFFLFFKLEDLSTNTKSAFQYSNNWLAPRSGYSPLPLCIPFTWLTALTLVGLYRYLFVS